MSASKDEPIPIPMQPAVLQRSIFLDRLCIQRSVERPDDNISDVLLKLTFLYRAFSLMWPAFMKIYFY